MKHLRPGSAGPTNRGSDRAAQTAALTLFAALLIAPLSLLPAGCGGGGGGSDAGGVAGLGSGSTGSAGTGSSGSGSGSGTTGTGTGTSGTGTTGTGTGSDGSGTGTTGTGSGTGTGGDGTGTTGTDPVLQTARARFSIIWAQRGRATATAPSSALSGVLTFIGGAPGGGNVRYVFNRDAARPELHGVEYVTSEGVVIGRPVVASLELFADRDGGGAVVGRAGANVTIAADGSGMPDLAVDRVIKSVRVTPDQTVPWDGLRELLVTARDAAGNVVPVSPGSVFFDVVGGTSRLRILPNHIAQGILPGPARVVAAVDDVVSPVDPSEGNVYVSSNAIVRVSPEVADPVAPGAPVQFTARVENALDETVSWSLTQQGSGTITEKGLYTAPQTPGTYTIIVTSVFDFQKTARATVVVR